MLTNFLKVTLRILYREKVYAIINIAGLSIAIACCLVLGLYLRNDLTYDRHNIKHKQIYRVENEFNINGRARQSASTSQYLGPMLSEEFPEIKGFVRFKGMGSRILIRNGDKAFYWENIFSVSDSVFDIFTHDIIYGNPETALIDPKSIAVSESLAMKYFGDSNPVGKTVTADGDIRTITLVFADLPENSHLKYSALFPYNDKIDYGPFSGKDNPRRLWLMTDFTYLLMPEGYNTQDFKKSNDSFFEKYMKEYGEKTYNGSWKCWLQPLADVHYNSNVQYDLPAGNSFYIYGFAAVAIFIILVACINYMNLTTARAAKRAKETGMRKILGSGRGSLVLQFTGEAIFFSFIAMILGYAIVELVLNLTPINDLLGKSLALEITHEPGLLVWMLVFSLTLGLVSGLYPALYLSSIAPLSALAGRKSSAKRGGRLRGVLVLVQFTISVCVIACTLLMFLQMRYMSNKSLGFNKENVLMIPVRGADLVEKIPVIKKDLQKEGSILGVALCDAKLHATASFAPFVDNKDNVPERFPVSWMIVGNDFIDVMGMELLEGRDFSEEKGQADENFSYIVNEAVVKKMGWDQPLGKRIQPTGGSRNGKVIGVVKDFNNQSLKNEINPFIMGLFSGVSQNQPRQ
ncbi:ABC transporter permease, partial [Thermodesulfobacteriota bacterium]